MTDLSPIAVPLTYRTATPDDLPALLRLGIDAYSPFASVLTPDNWEKLRRNLHDADRLAALLHQSTAFVCAVGDRIVGKVFLVPSGTLHRYSTLPGAISAPSACTRTTAARASGGS